MAHGNIMFILKKCFTSSTYIQHASMQIDENTVNFYVCDTCRYIWGPSTDLFEASNGHRNDSQIAGIYSVGYSSHKCSFRPDLSAD